MTEHMNKIDGSVSIYDSDDEIEAVISKGYAFFCGGWILNHHVSTKPECLEIIGNIYDNPELVNKK